MHRRIAVLAMAAAVSLSTVSPLHAAAVGAFPHLAADKQAAGKIVRFNIRNDSKQTLTLQAGEQQFSVESGKTLSMKLPVGTEVVAVNGTSQAAAGSVITKVSTMLQDNTLAVS